MINGPTEGILVGVTFKLFTAVVGPAFWLEEMVPGIQNNSLVLIMAGVTGFFTLIIKYVVHCTLYDYSCCC